MSKLDLFPREQIVGVFRGFSHGGLEFHAELALPYRNDFQSSPMHGQFLLVQLAHENEAVLGRVTTMHSDGRLASGAGEDFNIRAVRENREVPDDLRDQYLKYRVDIRVLGVLRKDGDSLVFAASHRRLPHVGSKVAFLSPGVLREIAGHNVKGADIGFFALGEFVYAHGDKRLAIEPWMQPVEPSVVSKFDIAQLVARRTFVFARAGFGKSNITKLLFSNLYRGETPTVQKRGGRAVPVGTIIFDPDGEYFWPDDKNRPGLTDIPELQDKIVVFTRRSGPSPFYQSFVAGDIKLDIRRLRPGDVISIALPAERQDQQNVRKLKGLNPAAWERLVNLINRDGNAADLDEVKEILHLDESSDAEATAARSNMTTVVRMLHDQSSQLMDMLLAALREGKLCVVDVSQLRGAPALVLSGLILNKIFETNQEEFTKAQPQTIPTIAVIEEAQSVLGHSTTTGGEAPYISWVKEGRKYDLGAVMITQQPGSITSEILSQGDNWFLFHLLSAGDLQAVKKANGHFSDDLLTALLNEPIPGHGVFWSSSGGRPYPVPIRALSFELTASVRDPNYESAAVDTFASRLRKQFVAQLVPAVAEVPRETYRAVRGGMAVNEDAGVTLGESDNGQQDGDVPVDVMAVHRANAIGEFSHDEALLARMRERGVPWKGVVESLKRALPETMSDRDSYAFNLVREALDEVLGKENWRTEKREKKSGPGTTVWVIADGTGK